MNENREQELLQKLALNKEKRIQNASNESKLRAIEEEDASYQAELEQIQKAKAEQEAAQQTRIEEATADAAYFLDNLVVDELTMRELCAGEDQYQMLRIVVQSKIISLAEDNAYQISAIQAEETVQQNALKKQIEELEYLHKLELSELQSKLSNAASELAQSKLETIDYQTKLRNATDEIDRLESHLKDLRTEIAVGARNAYKVIDSEEQGKQMKELADRIKASRIHVYDVVAKDINRANFSAKRADNGEEVTYNWTQAKNYIEIKDPNEVQQFRDKYAIQSAVQDPALVQPVQDSITLEETFPTLPSAIAPEVSALSVPGNIGQPETQEDIRVTEEYVEQRLARFAQEFGLVKQAVA